MRIALVPLNPTTGDPFANAKRILAWTERAIEAKANVAVFPELSLVGAPPSDLLFYPFLHESQSQALADLKRQSRRITIVCGGILADRTLSPRMKNVIYAFHNGQKLIQAKTELVTCGLIDENRYFAAGSETFCLKLGRIKLAFRHANAEWFALYAPAPEKLALGRTDAAEDILVFAGALPFDMGSYERHKAFFAEVARARRTTVLYVNLTGAAGEALFDGSALAFSPRGRVLCEAGRFREDLVIFDTEDDSDESKTAFSKDPWDDVRDALVMGLKDFAAKRGVTRAVIDLSGGPAHAVVARLACDALGEAHVTAVLVAARQKNDERLLAAKRLADRWGLETLFTDAGDLCRQQERTLRKTLGNKAPDAPENRLIATLLRTIADARHALLLGGATKTDLAFAAARVCQEADLNPLSDLSRGAVHELARTCLPAEDAFRPLMESPGSDPVTDRLIESWLQSLVEDKDLRLDGLRRLPPDLHAFWQGEPLRRRSPPGFRLTRAAFGRDWRMPDTLRPPRGE